MPHHQRRALNARCPSARKRVSRSFSFSMTKSSAGVCPRHRLLNLGVAEVLRLLGSHGFSLRSTSSVPHRPRLVSLLLALPAVGSVRLACCWCCSSLVCGWLCSFSSFHHSPDRRCSPWLRSSCPCCFLVVFSPLALWLWFSICSLSELIRVPLCGRLRFRGMLRPPPMPLCPPP